MESTEIDIKMWMSFGGRALGSAGKKKEKRERSRPKVTHIPLRKGSVCLNSVSPWGESQLNTGDQHQQVISNTMRAG